MPPLRSHLAISAAAAVLWFSFYPIKHALAGLFNLQDHSQQSATGWVVLASAILIFSRIVLSTYSTQLRFIWHVFLAPIGKTSQKERLERFYEGQADIYDSTRDGLLRGRKTMLALSASHLRQIRDSKTKNDRLVWIDIGGGTGYNIETMDKYFPIKDFDAVYLIDLCEPLLHVARKRFLKRGWKNVHVLCQDATTFTLPEWSSPASNCKKPKDPKGSVGFVTLSYSLSMMPNFYSLLDRIDYVLEPECGLLSVVDFYTSGQSISLHEKAIGGLKKECGWLSRWFWQIWFDLDHVSLSPQRRDYLEYKFGTIKSYNGRNRFVLPFIVRIPYYIWIGRSQSCDVSRVLQAYEVEGGNTVGNTTPRALKAIKAPLAPVPSLNLNSADTDKTPFSTPEKEEEAVVIDVSRPLSAFHYQIKNAWRLPYYDHPAHEQFRTFVYSFTWEDPEEDMKFLNLGPDDEMFVITSAGDNALHYAIAAQPRRIHCVDMNPCQNHLFELKLASIQALSYSDFFDTFGRGQQPRFRLLLDTMISPLMSSICYQFWRINGTMFTSPDSTFYMQGYSGWALRLARLIFKLAGITKEVERICQAKTIEEQEHIWNKSIRPCLLNPIVVKLLKSRVFCWNALGVPVNQRKMLLDEGSAWEYIRDTLDPIPSRALLSEGAYHYLLTLLGHYTSQSCPAYLTKEGFDTLRADGCKAMDGFRLHTDSIINTLKNLQPSSLTRAIIMDHLDWFDQNSQDVQDEVNAMHRALASGGFVLLRSAARKPWYMDMFASAGFKIERLAVREGNKVAIDGVNMYASLWRAYKL